jgi:hypothetical protein
MNPRLIAVVICFGLVGCLGPHAARMQAPDENDHREWEVRTIGDVTDVGAQPEIPVFGFGLVVGLDGTGGGPPPRTEIRDYIENELKKRGHRNVHSVLEDPNHTIVILEGRIPANCRRGDTIDIRVSLPPQSKCTSLKGGYLLSTELFNWENTKNLSTRVPEQILKGHPLVKAEGPVMVQLSSARAKEAAANSDDPYQIDEGSLKEGSVWSGGKVQVDPPLTLLLRQNVQSSRLAGLIAERINATFPGVRYGREGLAAAKNKAVVVLGVPLHYRNDLEHYLRVVRAIPLERVPSESSYHRRLAEQLLDPSKCLAAAIRLEALGEDSVPLLKPALSAPMPISRFAAARALTYLRKRDGVDELTRLIRQVPALRSYCLTAMASLDESICQTRLTDLMNDPNPEVRYGAFRALQRLDERNPEIAGEKCKDVFTIHQVAPDAPGMIHYLTSRRPEIVVFGPPPQLQPGLRILFGDEFSLTTNGDGTATVKRFSRKEKRVIQHQCGLTAVDVLKAIAELGGGYLDAVDMLNKAQAHGKLSCDLYHDALPRLVDLSQIARAAKDDPMLLSVLRP